MDKTLLKTKQQNPSQNTIENVMDLVVIIGINGIVLVLMETIMVSTGMWWILFGGILNSIGKMPKTHYKKEFCNGFTGKS